MSGIKNSTCDCGKALLLTGRIINDISGTHTYEECFPAGDAWPEVANTTEFSTVLGDLAVVIDRIGRDVTRLEGSLNRLRRNYK